MAILATAVWRARPSGSNTNGAGYDPGIAGAATDYSQQNSAQATGTHGSATGTTTFTDATALAFTSAMIGNAMYITGGGLTTGWYFVTGFTSSSVVTLDRTPGTGTLATWNLGGGWADFSANIATPVAGNSVFVLGSGTPNPASYTYDYDVTASGGTPTTNTAITIANDPATPGYKAPPDTTGGMPVIKFDVAGSILSSASANLNIGGLWFVGTTTAAGQYAIKASSPNFSNQGTVTLLGCVMDQFSFDVGLLSVTSTAGFGAIIMGCEIFTSVAPGAAGSQGGIMAVANPCIAMIVVDGCNIHDAVGVGILINNNKNNPLIINSIIAKCLANGITMSNTGSFTIKGCTIDGNLGNGIDLSVGSNSYGACINNNIISNHTQAATNGIKGGGDTFRAFIDYNVYYNNTSDLSALSYGPHDTHGGSNPYVGQPTENFTLA